MAISRSHTLGELIGLFFEETMKAPIAAFAKSSGLYFDAIGKRKARRGKKVTWADINGNRHDLDYVLERNGTEDEIGNPVAFIELAWRRYTKHSKNKAQEIAGAVNPIAERYAQIKPFKGAILSGDFTAASLTQLKSEGFGVLYIPFDKIVSAFAKHGLDIYFDEHTSESRLLAVIRAWRRTPKDTFCAIRKTLCMMCKDEISSFLMALEATVERQLKYVIVAPLYGKETELNSVSAAVDFIKSLTDTSCGGPLRCIEVIIAYTDGTRIDCQFPGRSEALTFLQSIPSRT